MFTESKTTEFKRKYVDDIKNTIIAFANSDGGNLYIGVNDDGSICGVDDADDTMLRVTNAVRDAIRPDVTMFVDCSQSVMDGKSVVYVSVQRGTARPYYLRGKGIRPEGIYVRQGVSTVPATEFAILSMIKETAGDSYEEARSINQQLTFNKTTEFFSKSNIEFGNAQMRTLHMIGKDDNYTNLAFLLSEQCTHTIKLAVYEGREKFIFKDRRELSGSLLEQLEEAYLYIDRNNRTRAEFSGLNRLDFRDYPMEAVREALLNSIIHKDYSFSSPILISIFDDRIEFVSVGGLVKGITLDDVKLGVSILRNHYLANIFYRLRLIEAYGTGILKINESYNRCNLKPIIESTSNAFKVTLPNINFSTDDRVKNTLKNRTIAGMGDKEMRINAVLKQFENKDSFIRSDIEAELGISQSSAVLLIKEMLDDGIIIREGKGKNIRYYKKPH